jgi:hypothetical protein
MEITYIQTWWKVSARSNSTCYTTGSFEMLYLIWALRIHFFVISKHLKYSIYVKSNDDLQISFLQ